MVNYTGMMVAPMLGPLDPIIHVLEAAFRGPTRGECGHLVLKMTNTCTSLDADASRRQLIDVEFTQQFSEGRPDDSS